jgi:hypothetical protein
MDIDTLLRRTGNQTRTVMQQAGPGQGQRQQQQRSFRVPKVDMGGASKRLGGKRRQLHNMLRAEGMQWRGTGVAYITNSTGADAFIWASSGTTTATSGGIKLPSGLKQGRLVVQNDGGTCDRIQSVTIDGAVIYTGAAPFPAAHVLIGKNTGVIDPLDKDVGMPVGDIDNTFDVQVWLANGDSAAVGLNAYTKQITVDVDNDDDAIGDEE